MKWEILKGSEKDFERAPEWATKLFKENLISNKAFFGELGGVTIGAYHENPRAWWKYNDLSVGETIAERRPITELDVNQQLTTEWDGDGLPPVGVECEFYNCEAWMKVRVKFVGEKYVALQDLKFDIERVYCVAERPEKFRPILSAEDVAKEKITLNMLQYMHSSDEIDYAQVCNAYEAIAAGKIPGVKLEGVK